MKIALRHRVCAFPDRICFVFGGGVSWIGLTLGLWWNSLVFDFAAGEPLILLGLIVAYLAIGALGAFVGLMLFVPVAAICRRVNRAPFHVGDRVMVLGGKYRGCSGTVYALCEGQGGFPLARVYLGREEARQSFQDLFDDFRLLRLSSAPS